MAIFSCYYHACWIKQVYIDRFGSLLKGINCPTITAFCICFHFIHFFGRPSNILIKILLITLELNVKLKYMKYLCSTIVNNQFLYEYFYWVYLNGLPQQKYAFRRTSITVYVYISFETRQITVNNSISTKPMNWKYSYNIREVSIKSNIIWISSPHMIQYIQTKWLKKLSKYISILFNIHRYCNQDLS